MLDCIAKLKDSIDYLTEQNDRKDKQIEKCVVLYNQVLITHTLSLLFRLRQDVTDMKQERRQASDSDSSPQLLYPFPSWSCSALGFSYSIASSAQAPRNHGAARTEWLNEKGGYSFELESS